MANAHAKLSHVFRVLRQKKRAAEACVLREFLLLLFNAVSLFCSALFRKTKVSCLKMRPAKHQINMCISQYQKDARAAVRKGRARLREQGVLKAAVPSMRPSDKAAEWEVAKPQIKLVNFPPIPIFVIYTWNYLQVLEKLWVWNVFKFRWQTLKVCVTTSCVYRLWFKLTSWPMSAIELSQLFYNY